MSGEQKETERAVERKDPRPFAWLYSVLGVSVVIFMLEYGVSQYANSGALQADCGHMFMDIVLYSQVVIAEHVKNVGFVKKNPRLVALLDLTGGGVALSLLLFNSYLVIQKAQTRLEDPEQHRLNEKTAPPTGFLSWVWESLYHDHDHDKVNVNERLVFAFCIGSLPINVAIACIGYSHVAANTDSWLDTIHGVVHPGCDGFHQHETTSGGAGLTSAFGKQCRTSDCPDCTDRKNPFGIIDGDGSTTRFASRRPTFNLVTVWVHIVSDIMKDTVLLISALIMMFDVVNRNRIDSVTAMVIVSLVLIGAVWTLPAIVNTLKIFIWGADVPESDGADEEQSLLINGSANEGERRE